MKEKISNFDGVRQYFEQCKNIVDMHNTLVLFGSAKGGEKVWSFLENYGLEQKVRCVVDNDVAKQGKSFHGIKIDDITYLKKKYNALNHPAIIIASGSAHIIQNQLVAEGFDPEKIYVFAFTNIEVDPTPCEFFWQRIEELEKIYHFLADEKSKKVFLGLINFKITMDVSYLYGLADDEKEQYFARDIFKIRSDECIVDCGAFIGDTLDVFAQISDGDWEKYYCFEADKKVYKDLQTVLENKKYKNVETYNIGCWNEKGIVYFNEQGSGASTICKKGGPSSNAVEIAVNTLDNVLNKKKVTFIKMDIEGAEQCALEGAKRIIREQQPLLAICIYHSLNDFIKIPQILYNCSENYRIYIRHYRKLTDSEIVCYAVPKGR